MPCHQFCVTSAKCSPKWNRNIINFVLVNNCEITSRKKNNYVYNHRGAVSKAWNNSPPCTCGNKLLKINFPWLPFKSLDFFPTFIVIFRGQVWGNLLLFRQQYELFNTGCLIDKNSAMTLSEWNPYLSGIGDNPNTWAAVDGIKSLI